MPSPLMGFGCWRPALDISRIFLSAAVFTVIVHSRYLCRLKNLFSLFASKLDNCRTTQDYGQGRWRHFDVRLNQGLHLHRPENRQEQNCHRQKFLFRGRSCVRPLICARVPRGGPIALHRLSP